MDHPTTIEECFALETSDFTLDIEELFCNATWDSLYCWPKTVAGSVVRTNCSEIFKEVLELQQFPNAFAFRECSEDGTWRDRDWTNYSFCLDAINNISEEGRDLPVEIVRYVTFIGALISLILLSVTNTVFICFRNLHCDRLKVHRNLIWALIIRFLTSLILTEPYISKRQRGTYREIEWMCKTLLGMRLYGHMASIFWMFVEGIFIHSRLTSHVFDASAPFKTYYAIGWGFPLLSMSFWCTMMTFHHTKPCWKDYAELKFIWILVFPMLGALVINLLFLISIVRIVVTKLKESQVLETTQFRKATRATLILFPLLGIPNLFFAFNPKDNGKLEDVYMITNALLQSSQGIFVSILHCFCNAEVQEVIRNKWLRTLAPHLIKTKSKKRSRSIILILPLASNVNEKCTDETIVNNIQISDV